MKVRARLNWFPFQVLQLLISSAVVVFDGGGAVGVRCAFERGKSIQLGRELPLCCRSRDFDFFHTVERIERYEPQSKRSFDTDTRNRILML